MSREKQIEEIAEITSRDCGNCSECEYVGMKGDGVDCVDCIDYFFANTIYNAGYRKQEWISVSERLPELNGNVRTWGELKIQPSVRVLCACKQKSGKVFVKEGFYELWGSEVVWKIPGSIDSVTHWMPLPEPPEGE